MIIVLYFKNTFLFIFFTAIPITDEVSQDKHFELVHIHLDRIIIIPSLPHSTCFHIGIVISSFSCTAHYFPDFVFVDCIAINLIGILRSSVTVHTNIETCTTYKITFYPLRKNWLTFRNNFLFLMSTILTIVQLTTKNKDSSVASIL